MLTCPGERDGGDGADVVVRVSEQVKQRLNHRRAAELPYTRKTVLGTEDLSSLRT